MTDRDMTRPTEHEQRVTEEMEDRSGEPLSPGPDGPVDDISGDPNAPSSRVELEAERRGTTADEVAEDVAEDERTPLDSAYQPRSG